MYVVPLEGVLKNGGVCIMGWDKIGVTIVSRPVSHGGGLYVRIPKKVVDAYELHTGLDIEVTVDRIKRPDEGNATLSENLKRNRNEFRIFSSFPRY